MKRHTHSSSEIASTDKNFAALVFEVWANRQVRPTYLDRCRKAAALPLQFIPIRDAFSLGIRHGALNDEPFVEMLPKWRKA